MCVCVYAYSWSLCVRGQDQALEWHTVISLCLVLLSWVCVCSHRQGVYGSVYLVSLCWCQNESVCVTR